MPLPISPPVDPMLARLQAAIPRAPGWVYEPKWEVSYDRLLGRRFRHATGFVRWRPDRDPRSCTFDQLSRM